MLDFVTLQGLRQPDRLVKTSVLRPNKVCIDLFYARGINRLKVLEVGMRGDVSLRIHHVHSGFHVLRELIAMLHLLCHGDKRHRLCAHGVNKHVFVLQEWPSCLSVIH